MKFSKHLVVTLQLNKFESENDLKNEQAGNYNRILTDSAQSLQL